MSELILSGINIIAFYSTTIFEQAFKNDPNKQFKAMIGSFGFGLVNWLFAFPAFFTIDSVSKVLPKSSESPAANKHNSSVDEACSCLPFHKWFVISCP